MFISSAFKIAQEKVLLTDFVWEPLPDHSLSHCEVEIKAKSIR